jgi:hypothetical protein
MKKPIILFAALMVILVNGFCQSIVRPVLKPEISEKYEGEMKKGLAAGKGTATGIDTYTGHFVSGLPDGQGTYTFQNGNVYQGAFKNGLFEGKGTMTTKVDGTESVVTGYWEAGKYVGKKRIDPYEISNKVGSVQEHISTSGEGNTVEISVLDPMNSYIGAQIFVEGEYVQKSQYGREYFEDVKFPILFDIKYSCSNKMRTGIVSNTIRIKIVKPGKWVIKLTN